MLRSGYVSNGQVIFYERAVKIYQREFKGDRELSCVSFPDAIQAIQSEAFFGCEALTSISIPDSVKKISTYCFAFCTGLTKVVLPSGIKVIDEGVFKGCTSLQEIVIPDSVTKIADDAFSGCSSLSKIVLPGKLKTIGEGAFSECKLESIDFPSSLESIGKDAFYKCPITKVHIPGNVKSLSGFHGTDLDEVIIDEGVEIIGEECFSECASLTSLTIPESVKMIDHAAFLDCTALKNLILPKTLDILEDEVFRGCSQLDRIDIPEGVTKIPHKLFVGTSAHIHLSSTVREFNVKTEKESRCVWHRYYFKAGENDIKSLSVSADNEALAIESDCLVDKQKRELLYIFANATEFPADLKSIKLSWHESLPPLLDVEELIIPEGVTYLNYLPFQQMGKLKKLVLPVSLKSVNPFFLNDYPFSSVSASPDFFLSNKFSYLPKRLDLIGVESVSDELRQKIQERFKGLDWVCVYGGGQLIYPTSDGLKAREETLLNQKKKAMAEKVEDMTLASLCKATFAPSGIAFDYLESENKIVVTIFDSLKLQYILKMDTARDDLAFLLDVATSFRNALNPYITESSDAHLLTRSEWRSYDGTAKFISIRAFPDYLVFLKLEQGSVAVAYQALVNLEKAYQDMVDKYGDKVEKSVYHENRY